MGPAGIDGRSDQRHLVRQRPAQRERRTQHVAAGRYQSKTLDLRHPHQPTGGLACIFHRRVGICQKHDTLFRLRHLQGCAQIELHRKPLNAETSARVHPGDQQLIESSRRQKRA